MTRKWPWRNKDRSCRSLNSTCTLYNFPILFFLTYNIIVLLIQQMSNVYLIVDLFIDWSIFSAISIIQMIKIEGEAWYLTLRIRSTIGKPNEAWNKIGRMWVKQKSNKIYLKYLTLNSTQFNLHLAPPQRLRNKKHTWASKVTLGTHRNTFHTFIWTILIHILTLHTQYTLYKYTFVDKS